MVKLKDLNKFLKNLKIKFYNNGKVLEINKNRQYFIHIQIEIYYLII